MKKIVFFLAAAAIALVSCNKETVVPAEIAEGNESVELVDMTFSASLVLEPATRAALESDRSVSFSAGDKIAVFANGNKYKFTTEAGGAHATFTGTAEIASTYYAIFPYSEDVTIDGNVIKDVNLSKNSVESNTGTFNAQQAIFVAKSEDQEFTFKNACALLKVTVPSEVTDLKEINVFNRATPLTGAISGTFDVTVSDSTPAVTITKKNGGDSDPHTVGVTGTDTYMAAGVYYIPVLPVTLTRGLDIKLTYEDYTGRAYNYSELTFKAGKVYDLGTIVKTRAIKYLNFEGWTLMDSGKQYVNPTNEATSSDYYISGNNGALAVVANPMKTSVNPSEKCLRNVTKYGSATSGVFQTFSPFKFFPSTLTLYAHTVQIKMYLNGDSSYYPRMLWNKGGTATLPARLNGVTISNQTDFDNAFVAGDWNVFEWDCSQFESKTDLKDLTSIQFRVFVDYSNNTTIYNGTTYNHTAYIDDLCFII